MVYFLILFTIATTSHAASLEAHSESPPITVTFDPQIDGSNTAPAPSKATVQQLMEYFLWATQGEHTHYSGTKDLLKSLLKSKTWVKISKNIWNSKRLVINSYRANSVTSGAKEFADLRDDTLNLAVFGLASHTVETLGGFLATGLIAGGAVQNPVAASVIGAVGWSCVVGEPVCMGFLYFYTTSKPLRKSLTFLRTHLGGAIGYVGDLTGFQKLMQNSFRTQDPLGFAQKNESSWALTEDQADDGTPVRRILEWESEQDPSVSARFEFEVAKSSFPNDGASAFLRALELSPSLVADEKKLSKEFRSALKKFHWNIRDMVYETLLAIRSTETKKRTSFPFVSITPQDNGIWRTEFIPRSVPLPSQKKFTAYGFFETFLNPCAAYVRQHILI